MQQTSRPLRFPDGLPALPTGFVTFLFSDIEGSTMRWQTYPLEMDAALRKHDVLMRDLVVAHGGHVFKTVGDEFCCVFQSAASAAASAIGAQRALAAEDWSSVGGLRVRMAMHTGVTSERDGDYFGTVVNHVARLLPAGYGGQILLTEATAAELDCTDGSLRDLGRHRLKDFPELETIHQLLAPDLPDIFPPLKTVSERPSNLPQHLAPLVGRDEDVEHVKFFLSSHRIVSIVGAGGVGKTSIALRVGTDVLSSYEDGVFYVELAPIRDADSVVSALAGVLHITSGISVLDALLAYLKNKRMLIVIDNCEHVIHAAAQLAERIAESAPNVQILTTTREPLAIAGEQPYRLPSLAVPGEFVSSAEKALQFASVQLFLERARAHVPSFIVTDGNARTVATICRRLDGIALAIELAAPRLRLLSVDALAEKLNERFRILTGGSRTALPRQQTMRALIEWSYDLLGEEERRLLRRASAFAGGWTLGAAIDVCADERLEAWEILDRLTSLVDKSLIVADITESEPRYRMLESTREYAHERAAEAGEAESIARRHAEYFLAQAQHADARWSGMNAKAWIAPLTVDLDNYRAALVWSIARHGDDALGVALLSSLEAFWWDAQPIEGRRWIAEAMPVIDQLADRRTVAKFRLTAANVALTLRQQKAALENADSALEAYRDGDELYVAAARRCRGAALINLGQIDEGETDVRWALDIFRKCGNRRLTALALRTLGGVPVRRGTYEAAVPIYREALAYAQDLCDERGIAMCSGNLAEVEFELGEYASALQHGLEVLEIARSRSDRVTTCTQLINCAAYLLPLERFEEARSMSREAISIAIELQSDLHLGVAIQHLAAVSTEIGDPRRAARLFGFSDAMYVRIESSREPTEEKEYSRFTERLCACIGAEFDKNRNEGAHFTEDAAVSEALLV